MGFLDQKNRIERIDKRIRLKTAGKPSLLAKEINISESNLYEVLKLMKKLGAPIKFSRADQSYYYTSRKRFICGFVDDSN
jgi:hypothetical protein